MVRPTELCELHREDHDIKRDFISRHQTRRHYRADPGSGKKPQKERSYRLMGSQGAQTRRTTHEKSCEHVACREAIVGFVTQRSAAAHVVRTNRLKIQRSLLRY